MALTFQEAVLRLQRYWAEQGALVWQPYSEKVGAGTMNPATVLRVLGREPWNVVYVEPSYRPDDGRYAENPNRMQMHMQLQVILKPDPGDPQERYLASLEALGIRREEHDVRFVEDNWESPLIGAWGLGWEVWLDGQEITQFTYFQQAGGVTLETPAVEITYGLERIVMYLQRVRSVWDIQWDEHHTYGEILRDQEVDYCRYNFDLADVDRLQQMYRLFEEEARLALEAGLVVPALDYILRCSHTFNVLDARGTVGVAERAGLFKRMRALTREVAQAYLAQRERAGFPWLDRPGLTPGALDVGATLHLPLRPSSVERGGVPQGRRALVFEIGTEELPAAHLSEALAQMQAFVPESLAEHRLEHGVIHVWGTPRRLTVYIEGLADRQTDEDVVVKGPPARVAFDETGKPTRAAQGFARSRGVDVSDLEIAEVNGGRYVVARQKIAGRAAIEVLQELLPQWVARLRFPRSMRWNASGVSFSRPIRWLTAIFGDEVIPCSYAMVESDRVTRGPRPAGSPIIALTSAEDYPAALEAYGILVDPEVRRTEIRRQASEAAEAVGGGIPDDAALLEEVTNLVEVPTAVLGAFEARYLALPQDVLIVVMKKHQRYFPVLDAEGKILPYFVTIRNGGHEHMDLVRQGNEDVIRARYADAEYFYQSDLARPLEAFRQDLAKLTFHAELGSMLEKAQRLEQLAIWLGEVQELTSDEMRTLERAAFLAKADLATKMVIEMTSLQGIMGREYALRAGEDPAVAQAIFEHYLPRYAGDALPVTRPGIVLGLADRMDSLTGLFAVGMAPSGSADPYGLRRTASGLVQILLDREISLSLAALADQALGAQPVQAPEGTLEAVLEFVRNRLRVVLRDEGLPYDVVEAALAAQGDDPLRARETTVALAQWVAREDWALILDNYARCVRITRDQPMFQLDPDALTEAEEIALYQALLQAEARVQAQPDVDTLLESVASMVPVIQAFFDKVLVMTSDETLRQARLALLQRVAGLATDIVDLSRLEGF